MSAADIIGRVLHSGILLGDLVRLPETGATTKQIVAEEQFLRRPLSNQHKALLAAYNGANLDVVRLYCCGDGYKSIKPLHLCQKGLLIARIPDGVVFSDDPAGFSYSEAGDGTIHAAHASDVESKCVARDMDDFFEGFVFGPRAKEFAGADWFLELSAAGIGAD
jgi:hypothetical protein